MFNFPTADGRMIVPAYTGGGMIVSAKAKNLDAAKRFALAFQLDKAQLDASVKSDGLIPAIIQDHKTGQVLVMCYMNRESIEKTIEAGKVYTYSRSRGRAAVGSLPGLAGAGLVVGRGRRPLLGACPQYRPLGAQAGAAIIRWLGPANLSVRLCSRSQ